MHFSPIFAVAAWEPGGRAIFDETYEGEVSFAGAAPYAVNGLTQINIKTAMTPVPGTGRLSLTLNNGQIVLIEVSLK